MSQRAPEALNKIPLFRFNQTQSFLCVRFTTDGLRDVTQVTFEKTTAAVKGHFESVVTLDTVRLHSLDALFWFSAGSVCVYEGKPQTNYTKVT